MKTVSVKEAASALGLTPRAVIYRLEKGDLKGTRSPNQYGVQEWRIYPNKHILTGLQINQSSESLDFAPEIIDAVTIETKFTPADRVTTEGMDTVFDSSVTDTEFSKESNANYTELPDRLEQVVKTITETITKPLMEELSQQRAVIFQLQREIAEKDNQLRLLPDLQKQADEIAQAKHFEVGALQKQIAALKKPWWKKLASKIIDQADSIAS